MTKPEVLIILNKTLDDIKKERSVHRKMDLCDIIAKYEKTINEIKMNTLQYNEIVNSVKAYLEIYNDYDNPLLYKMSDAENAVKEYLGS